MSSSNKTKHFKNTLRCHFVTKMTFHVIDSCDQEGLKAYTTPREGAYLLSIIARREIVVMSYQKKL